MKCKTCKKKKPPAKFPKATGKSSKKSKTCKTCAKLGAGNGYSYYSRNQWLYRMGYNSYKQYLKTSKWQKIRLRVAEMFNNQCAVCQSTGHVVHHDRYHKDDLLGKTTDYLYLVCNDCHLKIEFNENGRKNTMEQARDTFHQMMKLIYH